MTVGMVISSRADRWFQKCQVGSAGAMVFFHVFSIKFDPKQLAEIEPAETVTKRAADLYIL
jgi:hypothetical protein